MEIITTSLGREQCMRLRWWGFENTTLDFSAFPASESVQGFYRVLVDTFSFSLCLDITDSALDETFQFCAMKMDLRVGVLTGILYRLFLYECQHKCTFQLNDDHILSCI